MRFEAGEFTARPSKEQPAYRVTPVIVRIAVFFCAISGAAAASVDVCLVNEAALSRDTLRYVEAGLKGQENELQAVFRFTCESDSEGAVIVRLRHLPASNQLRDALGAVPVENGKVLGQVEVFCDSVRRMLRARWPPWPALEGWALSRVAAHELYHYLFNEHDHHNGRLNQEVMTAEGLVQEFRNLSLTSPRSNRH
jgi:hypothetical protein